MTFNEEHTLVTYKSMIKMSLEGLKTLFIVNGGAVVAMLAYLGQSSEGPVAAQHALWPLTCFIAGIVSCVFSFVGAYTTQFILLNENLGRRQKASHMNILWTTVASVLISLICFAAGAFSCVKVISTYGIPSQAKTIIPNCTQK